MKCQGSIKRDIIHVGLPKTGSTFLQNFFFQNLDGFCYFSPHRVWDSNLNWVFEINKNEEATVLKESFLSFKTTKTNAYFESSRYVQETKSFFSGIKQKKIISSEGLVGFSLSPLRNNLNNARFLKKISKNAKIIFIFRQQANYCESIYKQLIFTEDRYDKFLSFNDIYGVKKGGGALVAFSELDWFQLYSNYCYLFGKANVLALPYEYLLSDPRGYISSLERYIKEEASLTEEVLAKKVNISRCNPVYKAKSALFQKYKFRELEDNEKKVIMKEVRDSNKRLSVELGIDLSEYGYF